MFMHAVGRIAKGKDCVPVPVLPYNVAYVACVLL